ncbi:hypothetical protein [Fluviispira vulneris]|nr:hypothetical protein [Fluviispira vulneris]
MTIKIESAKRMRRDDARLRNRRVERRYVAKINVFSDVREETSW